jgi:hypothetical protein
MLFARMLSIAQFVSPIAGVCLPHITWLPYSECWAISFMFLKSKLAN